MCNVLFFLVAVIMKFMGDLPLSKHQKETDLVFSLLKVCDPAPVDFFFLAPINTRCSSVYSGVFADVCMKLPAFLQTSIKFSNFKFNRQDPNHGIFVFTNFKVLSSAVSMFYCYLG